MPKSPPTPRSNADRRSRSAYKAPRPLMLDRSIALYVSDPVHNPVPRKLSARIEGEAETDFQLLAEVCVSVAETEQARQEAHENRKWFKPIVQEGPESSERKTNEDGKGQEKYRCGTVGCGLELELWQAVEKHCVVQGHRISQQVINAKKKEAAMRKNMYFKKKLA